MPPQQHKWKLKIKPSLSSGHFSLADNIWGKTFRHLSQCLPQVFAYYCPPTSLISSDCRHFLRMGDYAHFSQDPGWWEESTQVHYGGCMTSAPPWHDLRWEKLCSQSYWHSPTQRHGVALKSPKMQYDIPSHSAPGKTIVGEMAFRLATVWTHPHQAGLSILGWGSQETHPANQHRR